MEVGVEMSLVLSGTLWDKLAPKGTHLEIIMVNMSKLHTVQQLTAE